MPSLKQDRLLLQTKNLLRQSGLRARKGLGQHFLIDEEVLRHIISAAELAPDDIVMEVGPGLGVLTRELAGKAGSVIAVELDDKLAAILKQSLASYQNVTIVNTNILDIDTETILSGQNKYKVVANLPYYITSPVLRHFLEASVKPEMMIVMVQKEVAEIISAGPGHRSLLSISVQFYGKPEIVSHVPARSFYPAPEVDSAILRIDLYPRTLAAVSDKESFFKLVRAGFTATRKQIANSLSRGLGIPKADALFLLESANISPQRRAGTLEIEEWAGLWQVYAKREKCHADCSGSGQAKP